MQPIYEVSNREWAQIRAALRLWVQVTTNSRTHPSQMPSVNQEFTEHGPMNLYEIEEMLENTPSQVYLTPPEMSKEIGVPAPVIKRRLKKLDIKPDFVCGRVKLYRAECLQRVMEDLGA